MRKIIAAINMTIDGNCDHMESIGETVMQILDHFKIDIDIEEAIRVRDW